MGSTHQEARIAGLPFGLKWLGTPKAWSRIDTRRATRRVVAAGP